MKTFWIILASVCGLLAVYFVFTENYDNAFVAAAAGAVCWFLNYRQQIRASMPKEEEDDEPDDEEVRS